MYVASASDRFDQIAFVIQRFSICFQKRFTFKFQSTNEENEALCTVINEDRRIHLVPSKVCTAPDTFARPYTTHSPCNAAALHVFLSYDGFCGSRSFRNTRLELSKKSITAWICPTVQEVPYPFVSVIFQSQLRKYGKIQNAFPITSFHSICFRNWEIFSRICALPPLKTSV